MSELTPRELLEAYPKVGKHKKAQHSYHGIVLSSTYFLTPSRVLVYSSREFYGDVLGNHLNLPSMEHQMSDGRLTHWDKLAILEARDDFLYDITEILALVEGGYAELEESTLPVLNVETLREIADAAAKADWTDKESFNELVKQLTGYQDSRLQRYRDHVNSLGPKRQKLLLEQLDRHRS